MGGIVWPLSTPGYASLAITVKGNRCRAIVQKALKRQQESPCMTRVSLMMLARCNIDRLCWLALVKYEMLRTAVMRTSNDVLQQCRPQEAASRSTDTYVCLKLLS